MPWRAAAAVAVEGAAAAVEATGSPAAVGAASPADTATPVRAVTPPRAAIRHPRSYFLSPQLLRAAQLLQHRESYLTPRQCCDDATAFEHHSMSPGRTSIRRGSRPRIRWRRRAPGRFCPSRRSFFSSRPSTTPARPGTVSQTDSTSPTPQPIHSAPHALHNRFVAGRLGVANVHGRTFAQAATFRGHFANWFWHRHHLIPARFVIGWLGPLFWPYL